MANYNINFLPRMDKRKSNGQYPIMMTISIAGKLLRTSTGISVLIENWDAKSKRIKFSKKTKLMDFEIDNMNAFLGEMESRVSKIALNFINSGETISSEKVLKEYMDQFGSKIKKKELPSNVVYDFIDQYIETNRNTRAKGSLQVYSTLKMHLKGFEAKTRDKFKFEDINKPFFLKFQNYLIEHTKLNNISIAKQLSTLKTFLTYAKSEGIKINDDIRDFKISREKLEVIALTQKEFDTLYNADFPKTGFYTFYDEDAREFDKIGFSTLSKIRDVFCFSCNTGLRYSDLAQLKRENIKANKLEFRVKKTKQLLKVPLTGYAWTILEKYKNDDKPLPVISNQKYNKYIKAVCSYLNIDEKVEIVRFRGSQKISTIVPKWKLISSHTGRKTFCTLSLERGMAAEVVMGVSGHTDYKSFQRYVNITEERKKNEMAKAWGEPKRLKVVGE